MTKSETVKSNPVRCMMCRRTTVDKGDGVSILMGEYRENENQTSSFIFEVEPEAYIISVCSECADVFERLFHRLVDPDSPHP